MGTAKEDATPLVDMGDCHDVFVSGIARIERLPGECLRFVCYVEEDSGARRVVVLKSVWPIALLPHAMRQTAQAAAVEPLIAEDGEVRPLH